MYGLWVELCCNGEPGSEGDEEKALYSHANCLGVRVRGGGGWWRRVCGRYHHGCPPSSQPSSAHNSACIIAGLPLPMRLVR
jgi:hypothetical protein